MSLHLDARRRAMLQEMGIALWLPQPAALPPQPAPAARPARPALAGAPVPSAAADAAVVNAGAQSERAAALRTPPPQPRTAGAPPAARPAAPRSQPGAPATSRASAAADTLPPTLYVHALQALYPQADAQQTPPELGAGWLVVTETLPPTNPHAAAARKLLDNMLRALRLHLHPRVFLLALERPAPHAGAPAAAPAVPEASAPSLVASAEIPATLGTAVAELQPSMVLLLGLLPARAALGRTDPLGALRASAHQIGSAPAVVSYAPDFLLRSQASKAAAWADLCHALALVRSTTA